MPAPLSEKALKNTVLDVYDVLHCLGPRFTVNQWIGQFKREASRETALRGFDRWKKRTREAGIRLEVYLEDDWSEPCQNPAQGHEVGLVYVLNPRQAQDKIRRVLGPA